MFRDSWSNYRVGAASVDDNVMASNANTDRGRRRELAHQYRADVNVDLGFDTFDGAEACRCRRRSVSAIALVYAKARVVHHAFIS